MFARFRNSLTSWTIRQLEGGHATFWLAIIAFAESSFFPIPPDFFMMPIVLRAPKRFVWYATVVTVFSILGALLGYLIGALFFDIFGQVIVGTYHLEDELVRVSEFFSQNAFLAIFTAAFTPIPYKIFTIAAGLFRIDLLTFVIASIIGRGLRFFAVAYISKYFGEKFGSVVFRYFNLLTWLFAVVVFVYVIFQLLG